MYIEYDNDTNRVIRMVSENHISSPPNAQDGRTVTDEPISVDSRRKIKQDAIDDAEYDPETEQAVAKLFYDTDTGEIYAEVEIREIEDEELE